MPDTVDGAGDGDGVPRWIRRERPRYPHGFMADPLKTYRLPMRADIRPGGDLRDTDLVQATLQSADLSGADLSGADLFQADLRNADLTGATLTGACLYGADLSGARLDGADLSGAELFNPDTRNATFDGAILKGAFISTHASSGPPASMRGSDLSGANVFWCTLAGVDLTGANLTGTVVRAPGTWQPTIGEDRGSLGGAVLDGAVIDDLVSVSDWPSRAKYRSTHPRRTRKGNFPEATRKEALARAGNRCEQCLATGRLDVDHVIAIADGGSATISNARVLCKPCHVAKTLGDLIARGGGSQARWIEYLKEVARVKAARSEAVKARKAAREARTAASVNPDG